MNKKEAIATVFKFTVAAILTFAGLYMIALAGYLFD